MSVQPRGRGRRSVLAGTALVACAALTACGSTVPLAQQGSAAPLGQSGITGPGSTGTDSLDVTRTPTVPGGALGTPTTAGAGGLGTTPGSAGGPSPRASAVQGPGVAATPGATAGVPTARRSVAGMTATTVKIGVLTAQGFGDFAASGGINAATGDQTRLARATIDYLNSQGGMAGRRIVPVFKDLAVADLLANPSAAWSAICSAFTEDDRVYALVTPVGGAPDSFYQCMSKRGVPVFGAGEAQDAAFFARYADTYYQPTDMNLRRIFSNTVDGLVGAGFFGPKAKIAVLIADTPAENAAVEQGLEPALARHGLKLADRFATTTSGDGASQYQSAVLRFRAAGVTHVVFGFLGSALVFMSQADSQAYYPKYGLHSRNSPATLLQTNASARQQQGAMGIGWQPLNDVDEANDPGVLNPRQALCKKLLQDSGQAGSGRIAGLLGLWMCDNFLVLRDALATAPSFALPGLRSAVESLGTLPSASTFKSTFGPGRPHDGAGQYRLIAFKDDCRCYQYVSPLKTAS